MALTLEQVEAMIDTLEMSIATGQLQVSYENKSVRYRDFAEMRQTLQWLEGKKAALLDEPSPSRAGQILMSGKDGW